jgi:DNA-binding transcriptional ArsR family regulator
MDVDALTLTYTSTIVNTCADADPPAAADPGRLRMLSLVLAIGESCVCDLTEPLGLTQPTVSHHLKVLVEADIRRREKRGRWAWFSPVPGALGALAAILGAAAEPTSAGARPARGALRFDALRAARW